MFSASGSGCPAWNSTAFQSTASRYTETPSSRSAAPGHLGQPGQQVIEQHVIGGQRHGLGQGRIQPGAGGQPLAAVGPAEAAG